MIPFVENNLSNTLFQKIEDYEAKSNVGQPPPGHTRGKWVPGAQTDIESGYWCSPCGRKLASRLVYNRHLLSDLHARRSIRELDGVFPQSRVASLRPPRKTSTRTQVIIAVLPSNLDTLPLIGGWSIVPLIDLLDWPIIDRKSRNRRRRNRRRRIPGEGKRKF